MGKKKEPREVSLREFLDNVRSCQNATVRVMKAERKKDEAHEKKCYRDLFKQIVGRTPTPEELMHMLGFDGLPEKEEEEA